MLFIALKNICRLEPHQKSRSAPKNSENPNKNIIHNLCSSACSLLGYRYPGTYDGCGIVYGNASRLCDAILAFLYAVFSDVHANQPYVAGRDVLHDVVVEIESQLWRGHKGFCQVIPKVANGLRDYNTAVEASNDRVKKPIETVLAYVKPGGELRKGINDLHITEASTSAEDEQTVESAVTLVEKCKEVARAFSKSLTAATDAIDDLNPKLKRKLENARRSFFNHVDWLSKWSKKGQKKKLDKMIQKIKSRLKQLAKAVKEKIKQEVHTVVKLSKKRVREIRMKLEGITASLEKYVKELGTWMEHAKKYINKVREYLSKIMQQLDGPTKREIDRAAGEIDKTLSDKVGELREWIEKAEAAVKAAKEKADEVYGRLDKENKGQKISQGIEKINTAKDAVAQVDAKLQKANDDLEKWREAAQLVLSTALSNAENVHKQLDPATNKSTLSKQIDAIDTARQGIVDANTALGKQVENLHKWIHVAEEIRQKAETKAKEAYDKLKVHEELSKNVKRIVDAKDRIANVHREVDAKVKELGSWNEKAKEVINGAVEKAQEVHDKLRDAVVEKIGEIEQHNKEIITANNSLEKEVGHLGKWRAAAGKVIDKVNEKCDKILEKVNTDLKKNNDSIYNQATVLKDSGTKLLQAAQNAKQAVEEKVAKALEAVKEMDSELKRDLFDVKKKINKGIAEVIKNSGVDKLGEKVKADLQKLRGNIEGLTTKVDEPTGSGLVKEQLAELAAGRGKMDEAKKNIQVVASSMDHKFKESIKQPLNDEVEQVTEAIKALYEEINPKDGRASDTDKKKLHKILEHIKRKVADIKGIETKGKESGLDGIVSKVRVLAQQFNNATQFEHKVNGFVMEILKENMIVQGMLKKFAQDKGLGEDYMKQQPGKDNSLFNTDIALIFQQKLRSEAHAAGKKAAEKIREAESSGEKIKGYITAVKKGLTTFVDEVEKNLKVTDMENLEDKIDKLVDTIFQDVSKHVNQRAKVKNSNDGDLKLAVKRIFMKLIVIVRKVAKEVKYLGISVFGEMLDETKLTVDALDKNLKAATSSGTPATGTAQAVDEAIGKVKTEVGGLDGKFNEVKQPLETAVRGLESAVEAYDAKAKEQLKEAAKVAIDQAANVISEKGRDADLRLTMNKFHQLHEDIKTNLEKNMLEKVDGQLPHHSDNQVALKQVPTLRGYSQHINQNGAVNGEQTGELPNAINSITIHGLDALNKHIDGKAKKNERITQQSFTDPFEVIEEQLKEITNLVKPSRVVGNHDKSVKNLLEDLRSALDSGNLDGASEKGLGDITKIFNDLQKNTFRPKPEEISKAVEAIRKEIEELKQKLKNSKGNDVVATLKDLKETGLGINNDWQPNGKDPKISGIGKIRTDLEEQNKQLPKLTNEIDNAIDKIKWELACIGYKLQGLFTTNDVIDELTWLKSRIGKGEDVGLQAIHKRISDLQENEFRTKPEVIEKAKEAIDEELKLQSDLQGGKNNGVIGTLRDLKDVGLNSGDWKKGDNSKGLEKIENELKAQQNTLSLQPGQINLGVNLITKELEELRNKLRDGNSGKDSVINALNNLQVNGLGQDGQWNGKNGLGKIRSNLQEQTTKLSSASTKIGEATQRVLQQTQSMLQNAKQKLSDQVANDDILDSLKLMGEKIGLNGSTDDATLRGMYKKISGLQNEAFTNKSKEIGKAKQAIDTELKKLQGDLQDAVANPLNDLMQQGFGSGEQWNNNDAKGFDNIKSNLQSQQSELSNQPKNIQTGVDEIINELQSLRAELQGTADDEPKNRGVVKNLDFMTEHIGGSENKGLKKMKSDIESLKSQVPVITKHLNTMSLNITNAAGPLGFNLNQLANPHIDKKLKGIESGLTNLRLTDLAEAIRLCDDFLIKANDIEKNTIDALLKHVDDEVDDAIKDLTKEARGLYVDSVREALELFARKVEGDLEQLPGDINRDRYMGYKGFMKYLQGPLSSDLTGDEHSVAELSSAFQEVFEQIEKYVKGEITRLHDEQNKEQNPSLPPTEEPYTLKLNDVYDALTALLVYFRDNEAGTDRLTELVERLTKALSNMLPSDFKHPSTPLLDTVSRGLSKFASEFHNTYISAYSGQRCREEHAHKYAKVLLSMIPMTHEALTKLMKKCESEWKALHITQFTADERDNPLGNYFTRCGYRVSSSDSGQDGELNNTFTGAGIYELLSTPIEDVAIEMLVDGGLFKNGITLVTLVAFLYNVLCHYFQVCHIYVPPNPRYPCTVRDMLSWLSGLQYTQVADKLPGHCKALLNRRCHDGDTPNKDDPIMAKCIEILPLTIATTCSYSTALLTAIQGNGHGFDLAAYPYSVDFSNNRAKLHCPSDPAELLDMLREIVCRLCRVLYFLYSQCCRSTARVKGWRECAYGRQVQSHHWQCGQFGTQSAVSAITTTTATITSSTIHGCPPTSPLQSFLSDSCHGLLPHTLTAANMVIECANCIVNQPGQQCLTPLGFWDLGFAASISGTGWDLAKSLGDMCRDADSCLFVLCRTLFLLCPAAPSSLADVFALYAQVLRQWDPHDRVEHRGGTYTDASDFISHLNTDGIDSLFPLCTELHGNYENGKLTTAIASLAGHDHKNHDALSSLFHESTCKSPSGCAPYLQPLGLHAHHNYPRKHAGLYITWIMYLAWQFWELLTHLLHALDNIDCTASGCATCPCQPGTHGEKDTCQCPSIVQCAGPLPTLYRYGFTYRNANMLVTGNRVMRCGDLNTQLKEALHSDHFTELFRQIDQLVWHIRMPFVYFLIALWSFVALYILHTFLYRIDILRIRSHLLTTTASHLIDVKALLIPSRKMLSLYDASYFDDDPSELLDAT